MSTQLLTPPVSILASFIIDAALMTDPSDGDTWPLYKSSLPDGDAIETNAGAIYDTAGIKDGRYMVDGTIIDHYGMFLRIRCKDYETGWAKIEAIAFALDAIVRDNVIIGGQTYRLDNVSRNAPPEYMGLETGTKRRFLFEINYTMTITNIT